MQEEEEAAAQAEAKEPKLLSPVVSVIDLPDAPKGYAVRILSQLNASYSNRFSRMSAGPGGVYFACDGSVWFVDQGGQLTEYARIRGNSTISGLRFDRKGVLYVSTIQGTVYRIDPNKSGRILPNSTVVSQVVARSFLILSSAPKTNSCLELSFEYRWYFRVDRTGEYEVILGGPGHGIQGLLLDTDGYLWCLEHSSGSIVKRSLDGREMARVVVAEPECFNFADGYDGNLAMDSLGRLYVTAGRAGSILRINREGRSEIFLNGLVNPTGIAFGTDGSLFVLEAGRSRVLRVAALERQTGRHRLRL